MKHKAFRAPIELKSGDGAEGTFRAVFATFNVVDRDGDVTRPGAFKEGQPVRISAWGHNWGVLPVGKGVIHADGGKAWVDGAFFLETTPGRDTWATVAGLGSLQEWSYGFDILKSREGTFEGASVRFLEALDVYEVSPVMLGAGVGTRTEAIKNAGAGLGLTPRALLKMSAGEIYAWADASLYADAKARVGADAPSVVKRLDAELDDLVAEDLGELQGLLEKSADAAPFTNLDAIEVDVASRYGNMPAYYRRSMVEGALGDLVERDLRQQELTAGVSPNRAVATERVMRWARSPARL